MALQHVIVAAFILYAVFYLGRYGYRMFQGRKTGCGCGTEHCPKGQSSESK